MLIRSHLPLDLVCAKQDSCRYALLAIHPLSPTETILVLTPTVRKPSSTFPAFTTHRLIHPSRCLRSDAGVAAVVVVVVASSVQLPAAAIDGGQRKDRSSNSAKNMFCKLSNTYSSPRQRTGGAPRRLLPLFRRLSLATYRKYT